MPQEKRISKTTNYVKLYSGDKTFIKNMIAEYRISDKKFENESAAIRHYVHVGIAAEISTTDIRKSLDNAIVKQSQIDATRQELKPLCILVENLTENLNKTFTEINDIFGDVARRTDLIENKVTDLETTVSESNQTLQLLLKRLLLSDEHIFRNLIVLRSMIYIFLLGHKAGRIAPGMDNLQKWNDIINLAHDKANQLSIEEVKTLSTEYIESRIIQQMAIEIFEEINKLPKPKIVEEKES